MTTWPLTFAGRLKGPYISYLHSGHDWNAAPADLGRLSTPLFFFQRKIRKVEVLARATSSDQPQVDIGSSPTGKEANALRLDSQGVLLAFWESGTELCHDNEIPCLSNYPRTSLPKKMHRYRIHLFKLPYLPFPIIEVVKHVKFKEN